MTQYPDPYTALLICIPIIPVALLGELDKHFDRVIYRPDDTNLPTEEEYSSADVLYTFRIPSNLKSIAQVPKLKFIQLHSAGVGHITIDPFFQTIPDSNPLILASASGYVIPVAYIDIETKEITPLIQSPRLSHR